MLRISKVLWGTGLVTVGAALLLYSQQEHPSRAALSQANGVAKEIRVSRGFYKIHLTGHEQTFGFNSSRDCEDMRQLKQGINITLLYEERGPGNGPSKITPVLAISSERGPICSSMAVRAGATREKALSLKLGIPMVVAAALFFISALLTKNLTTRSRPTPSARP